MELEMPDVDDTGAMHCTDNRSCAPVVVLVANETSAWIKNANAAGMQTYLLKPHDARELERAITIAMTRFHDVVELRRLNAELQKRTQELEEALAQVTTLSGFLPICASCKNIRNDEGHWEQIETYIRDRSQVEFSHGICPDCARKMYPDYFEGSK